MSITSIIISSPSSSDFEYFTIDNGLSSNYITCTIEDRNGFKWVGTSKGLNRFDGKNFKIYVHDPAIEGSLSDSHISYLLKDSYDEIWIGTVKGGLCKYNQKGKFDCFQFDKNDDTSISHNQIWSIYEDHKKRLWIGTQNGLNLFNRETNTFTRFLHDPNDPTSLPGGVVLSFLEDQLGRLWIGTWAEGIALFQPSSSGTINESSFLPLNLEEHRKLGKNNIWSMEMDKEGRIWVGVRDGGLFLCEPPTCHDSTCSPQDFNFYKISSSNLFNQNIILDLKVDHQNKLWIGSSMGIFAIDLSQKNAIRSNGKKKEKEVDYLKMNTILPNQFVNHIYQDQENIVWFSTKNGLHKYTNYLKSIDYRPGPPSSIPNSFIAFCQDASNPDLIWTGQTEKGLQIYSLSNNRFTPVKFLQKEYQDVKNISTIYQDKTGNMWITTLDGLILILKIQDNIVQHVEEVIIPNLSNERPIQIWNLFEDSRGRMVFSTHKGIYFYDRAHKKYIGYSEYDDNKTTIIGHNVFDAIEDEQKIIWVATAGGGLNRIKFQGAQPKFKNYLPSDEPYSIKNNILYDLHLVNNSLWVGTQTGIQEFDILTEKFLPNDILDKAITGQILSITSDSLNHIWFTTDNGIFQYHTKKRILSQFNQSDGVVGGLGLKASYSTNEGQLLFGGLNGFNYIFPNKMLSPSFPNNLLITDIKIFNKSVPIGVEDELLEKPILQQPISVTKKLELSHQHDFFSLEFSALDYLNPRRYSYAYQLVGFDKDWINTGTNNAVNYTNLHPGTYTFKVKAKNHLGVWSQPKELLITIKPPFWKTFPFLIISTLGSIFLLFFLQNRREYKIKKYNEQLEEEVSDRTEELKNTVQQLQHKEQTLINKNLELKKYIESNQQLENFASIASHDLQAPLRTIKSFAGLLEKSLGPKMNDREREFTHYITSSTKNMQDLVNALLTFSRINSQKRHIESVSVKDLLYAIQTDLSVTIEERKATIEVGELPSTIMGDRIKLKQLLQNLISNGMKFSKKEVLPKVNVHCKELDNYWEFEVADNGIGISKKYNDKIFQLFQRLHTNTEYEGTGIGLSLCKKLVEQHEGDIWVESEEGQGSRFFFTVSKNIGNQYQNLN